MTSNSRPTGSAAGRLAGSLCQPLPPKGEVVFWAAIVALIAWPRIYLWTKLPVYLWSKDAGSYAESAFRWLDTGVWITDPRRGPVYSLLMAWILKLGGTWNTLIIAQHFLGAFAVLMAVVVLRRLHGARAWFPLLLCAYAYAVYANPIAMEHLVRNETLLFVLATTALGCWWKAIETRCSLWLLPSGLAAGVLSLLKNVFVPFPLIVLGMALWMNRNKPLAAWKPALIFLAAFALPIVGSKLERKLEPTARLSEPQSGLLLFARVAQFTVLDGGIEPEAKEVIREDIEAYRKLPELDNNVPLNRTAVPHLRNHLLTQGKTPTDLNKICRRLAVEAIMAHRAEYFRQFWTDLCDLHMEFGTWIRTPDASEVQGTLKQLRTVDPRPAFDRTTAVLSERTQKNHFRGYARITNTAWLFQFVPVLLTSLILPFLVFRDGPEKRGWWIGCAILWYFTVILLSTVGKPLHRYLLPVVPIMFWTLGSAVTLFWFRITEGRQRHDGKPSNGRLERPFSWRDCGSSV